MHPYLNLNFSVFKFQIHSEILCSYSLFLAEVYQRLGLSAPVISVPHISLSVAHIGGHRNVVGLYIISATCTLSQPHAFLAHTSGQHNVVGLYIIIATCTLSQLHVFLAHSSGQRNVVGMFIIIATCTLTVSYTHFSRIPVASVT